MELITLGVNHKTAPISLREKIAFNADQLEPALRDLVQHNLVREAAIVSTCNRTEVYCATADSNQVSKWLASFHGIDSVQLAPYVYTYPSDRAVTHVFRVASGLESMVVGEPQILGQLKQAVRSAEHAGTLGAVLHKLFQRSFSVAKEVRSHTEIGTSSVSMAAAAVRIAERIFPSITQQSILFIGAGEMIELCAAHFCGRSPKRVVFANRTLDRAFQLAQRFSGEAIGLQEIPTTLASHDVVVSCTASVLPLIGKGLVESAVRARRHRPILIIDLAVPRDVEPEVGQLEDVFLYTVDDLGKIVKEGVDLRRAAVAQAEKIIGRGVDEFMRWLLARDSVPTIKAFRAQAESVRLHELEKAMKALTKGSHPESVLEALSISLTNKFLHGPTHALNDVASEERDRLAGMLSRLYFTDRRQ